MAAPRLNNSSELSQRASAAALDIVKSLARPEYARRLRLFLLLLLGLWTVLALTRLLWTFLPAADNSLPPALTVLNPATSQLSATAMDAVDIDTLVSWHLFGEVGALGAATAALQQIQAAQAEADRQGIEDGARETRLDVKLRGVVAASIDGLGIAVIEYKNKQQGYAVEDQLPVPGKVTLAKVMVGSVVLDNRGTYELLTLFDDSALMSQLPTASAIKPAASTAAPRRVDGSASAIAQDYRQRLYQNPQSLAEIVRVSAVREQGQLRGYRIAPGKDQVQFQQLGFQTGDMITSINGIALDDPSNTVKLYQLMRTVDEAIFELERAGEAHSVVVNLGSAGTQQ